MEIRTFEAFSMKEAVKAIKKNLGHDAVILSTREKKAQNGNNLIFEVKAAAANSMHRLGAQTHSYQNYDGQKILEQSVDSIQSIKGQIDAISESIATRTQVGFIESGLSELKSLLIEALRGKNGSTLNNIPPYLIPIEQQMRAMGVDESTIIDLIRELISESIFEAESSNQSLEIFFRDKAIRWMMKRIKIAPRWQNLSGTPAIHTFVGPSGSGKTSLIAKIAAHLSKKQKNKVKILSVDQNRLAAMEQMRIFCKILDISFQSIIDFCEFEKLITDSSNYDFIFVDTPGLSPKDHSSIKKLLSLRSQNYSLDYHLILSLTEKESQMDHAVRSFSCLGLNSLAFTKLDESWSFGEIYNIAKRWAIPLSFFSVGHDIPRDLERASRERVVEQIFGVR